MVLDVSSSRHFFIGVFDVLSIIFCLFMVVKAKERFHWKVLKTKHFVVWLLLIIIMFISFLQSVNIIESIVVINRWFVIFICALMTTFLIERDKKMIDLIAYISIIVAAINVLECIIPYYVCEVYVSQRRNLMLNGCYGNKNIFSVAMLLKLPFLYYAFFKFRKFWKWFALALVFLIAFCLVILSTRTSFIGLFIQIISLTVFIIISQKRRKWKSFLIILIALFGLVCGNQFITFNYNHYAKKDVENFYTLNSRFESIAEGNSKGRLKIWKNTLTIIKENPLLGYGIGNHKFAIMKAEAPQKINWVVSDHAHNDYLEMWSELGLFGLVCYLSFAVLCIILSAKYAVSKRTDEAYRWVSFMALLCFLTYFNEAMFNFPAERACTQMYLAIGIAFLSLVTIRKKAYPKKKSPLYFVILLIIAVPILYVETSHYISSIMQRQRIYQTNGNKKVNYTFEQWVKRMPCIPNVDENCKPIAVNTASIAISNIKKFDMNPQKEYRKAIDLLLTDNSNPYYGLKEYRLCNYYYNLPQYDSALLWANRCIAMKPLCYDPVRIVVRTYEKQGDYNKAKEAINDYTTRCNAAKVSMDANSSKDLKSLEIR
jgi:O-antigen ligase